METCLKGLSGYPSNLNFRITSSLEVSAGGEAITLEDIVDGMAFTLHPLGTSGECDGIVGMRGTG